MNAAFRLAKRLAPASLKKRVKCGLRDYFQAPDVAWSLENMKRLGFAPKRALDIGAYKGEWTTMARAIFPDCKFLMLEAQQQQGQELEQVKQGAGGRVDYRIALLGPENRDGVVFNQKPNAPTASSMLADWGAGDGTKVACQMRTLDSLLAEEKVEPVDLIKMDVQGYELEVLKGASRTLESVQALMMEVSLIDLYQNNPLLHEVTAFMAERGFIAYDIPALHRRPLDQALAQVDITFVPKSSPLVKNKKFAAD